MRYKLVVLLCFALLLGPLNLADYGYAAAGSRFSLHTSCTYAEIGEVLSVRVEGQALRDVYANEVKLAYDSAKLRFDRAAGPANAFMIAPVAESGQVLLASTLTGEQPGYTGDHVLYTLSFTVISPGRAALSLSHVKTVDSGLVREEGRIEGGHLQIWLEEPPSTESPSPGPTPTARPGDQVGADSAVSSGMITLEAVTGPDGTAEVQVKEEELRAAVESAKGETVDIRLILAGTPQEIRVRLPAVPLVENAQQQVKTIAVQTDWATVSFALDAVEWQEAAMLQLVVKKAERETWPEEAKGRLDGVSQAYEFQLFMDDVPVGIIGHQKVLIQLPYVLSPGEGGHKLVVYEIADSGVQVVPNGKYSAVGKTIGFRPAHFGKYAAVYADVAFADLAAADWAREAVEGLAAREAVNGVGAGRFHPEGEVTRAEFVAMLARIFGIAEGAIKASVFSDVTGEEWYAGYVAAAAELGIAKGREDGTFGPDDPISRQDMAVIVHRVTLKLKISLKRNPAAFASFGDQGSVADYAAEAVEAVRQAGLVNGVGDGLFAPLALSTRVQAAALIYRLFREAD